jgi:hypothetical protein
LTGFSLRAGRKSLRPGKITRAIASFFNSINCLVIRDSAPAGRPLREADDVLREGAGRTCRTSRTVVVASKYIALLITISFLHVDNIESHRYDASFSRNQMMQCSKSSLVRTACRRTGRQSRQDLDRAGKAAGDPNCGGESGTCRITSCYLTVRI